MLKDEFTDLRVVKRLELGNGPTITVKEKSDWLWPALQISEKSNDDFFLDGFTSIEVTDQEAAWLVEKLSAWLQELKLQQSVTSVGLDTP